MTPEERKADRQFRELAKLLGVSPKALRMLMRQASPRKK